MDDNQSSSEQGGKKPLKVFREGDVSASVFDREHEGQTYYSVTFSRSYKSGSDWRYSKWFDHGDLPKVAKLAQAAHDHIGGLQSGE
jgi:hypothetical protein